MLWSILSKALEKSIMHERTIVFGESVKSMDQRMRGWYRTVEDWQFPKHKDIASQRHDPPRSYSKLQSTKSAGGRCQLIQVSGLSVQEWRPHFSNGGIENACDWRGKYGGKIF
jgi:hypothetical protein